MLKALIDTLKGMAVMALCLGGIVWSFALMSEGFMESVGMLTWSIVMLLFFFIIIFMVEKEVTKEN